MSRLVNGVYIPIKKYKDCKKIKEGYSNYLNILQEISIFLEEELEKLNGKSLKNQRNLSFKKEIPLQDRNEYGLDYINIVLKLDPKKTAGDSTFSGGRLNPVITIGIESMIDNGVFNFDSKHDLDSVMATLAHEITHYSQMWNRAMEFDLSKEKEFFNKADSYWKKKYNIKKPYDIYTKAGGHIRRKTEKESKLIEFFTLIKRKNYKKAFSFFEENLGYFDNFNFRQILSKMDSFEISFSEDYKKMIDYSNETLQSDLILYRNSPETFFKEFFNSEYLSVYKEFRLCQKVMPLVKNFFDSNLDRLKRFPSLNFSAVEENLKNI